MKLCAISCEVFTREASRAAAFSPHVVDLSILPFGLHSYPDKLRETVQAEIDKASDGGYDYLLMAYGLCSRGLAGLTARNTPIVIPRAHDCITLLLGSKERYQEEFSAHPGTYYFSPGWIERMEGDLQQGMVSVVKDQQMRERYLEYVEKYGEDNAKFLIEQENQWLSNYNRAVFLDVGLGDIETYRSFTRHVAETRNWSYEEVPGSLRLIDNLFNGGWDESDFLVVEPGRRTVEDVNTGIISAV